MKNNKILTPERQIVLDTETTGMNQNGKNHYEGHKIIEIGAVEVINRRLTGNHFHVYINPERLVEPEAFAVHGISDEFLKDKPLFKTIANDFIAFIDGAELVIHNATFDVGFMDYEIGANYYSINPFWYFCSNDKNGSHFRRKKYYFVGNLYYCFIYRDSYYVYYSRIFNCFIW